MLLNYYSCIALVKVLAIPHHCPNHHHLSRIITISIFVIKTIFV